MGIRKDQSLKQGDKYTWEITAVPLRPNDLRCFGSAGMKKQDPITDHMKKLRNIEDRMEALDNLKDRYLDRYAKKRRKLFQLFVETRKSLVKQP